MEKPPQEESSISRQLVILETVNPINSDITKFRFTFEGIYYDMEVPEQSNVTFSEWLSEYTAKTPRCACCSHIIFPRQPIVNGHLRPNDSGASHFSEECNSNAEACTGSFNDNGEFIPFNLSRFINNTEK